MCTVLQLAFRRRSASIPERRNIYKARVVAKNRSLSRCLRHLQPKQHCFLVLLSLTTADSLFVSTRRELIISPTATMKAPVAIGILSMGAAQIFAAPVLDERQDDFIWSNPDGEGNTQVSIGDGKMRFGHLVPSSTLDLIDEHCTSTGCKPNEDLTATALLVNSDIGTESEISMQVEGSFNAAGDRGSKAQLLDLAKQALQKLYDDGIAEREEGVIYQEKTCPGFHPTCNSKFRQPPCDLNLHV